VPLRVPRPRETTPSRALKSILLEEGCSSVRPRVWVSGKKVSLKGFQYLAVEMLVNEYSLKRASGVGATLWEEDYRGKRLRIVGGRGSEPYDCELIEGDKGVITWRDLEARLPDPPFPLITIDLGLWRLHSPEESARLRIQLAVTLSVIRDYLWDRHLALTSVTAEVKESLNSIMGKNKVMFTSSRPNELLWGIGAEEVIILRPDAPEPLTADDVLRAQAFLIGGIVDLIPRRGVSRVLDRMVPWGKPRKIVLRGSIVGVPERINRVVEIILKARLLYNGDVEKAVISSMTKRDLFRRLFVEIMRSSEERGGRRIVDAELYYSLRTWLPVSWEDFLEAARKAKAEVRGA
jgi:tRNA (adenine9-N1/guanine9-N1)-methyltransferase